MSCSICWWDDETAKEQNCSEEDSRRVLSGLGHQGCNRNVYSVCQDIMHPVDPNASECVSQRAHNFAGLVK